MNSCRRIILTGLILLAGHWSPLAAEDGGAPTRLGETVLDFDRDGRPDKAILVESSADRTYADLHIYFGDGDKPLDPSGRPGLIKEHLLGGHFYEVSAGAGPSLVLSSRCGGCSNEYVTTLRIVDRDKRILVAGFSASWERRDGRIGDCDINFLTGQGFASRGLNAHQTRTHFRHHGIAIADWSESAIPRECVP